MSAEDIDFLHHLRATELERALRYFRRTSHKTALKVLEVGAGTGHQARLLSDLGYDVTAIDLPGSAYSGHRIFPVTEYDGRRIPADDRCFDVVFSSNVLEHVPDVDDLLEEMLRVTADGGVGIHLLPTPVWRFWTAVTHYIWLLKSAGNFVFGGLNRTGRRPLMTPNRSRWRYLSDLVPARHGERGTLFTEGYYFSTYWWKRKFEPRYRIEEIVPTGIFYTGSGALGQRLPIGVRRLLASVLGSACKIYIVHSRNHHDGGSRSHDH